jgi:hypothetical protein
MHAFLCPLQVTDLQATIEKLRMELVEREAVMADSYDTLSGLRRKVGTQSFALTAGLPYQPGRGCLSFKNLLCNWCAALQSSPQYAPAWAAKDLFAELCCQLHD